MSKFKLSDGFVPINYGYMLSHQYIGNRDNIGKKGVNLTIVAVSCNRSALDKTEYCPPKNGKYITLLKYS